MTTIKLSADAAYGYGGKQFVARITGRDSKFTFQREFLGRKEGKRGDTTSVTVDDPGLYQTRDIDRKGRADDTYWLVWLDEGQLDKYVANTDEAMALARKMDDGKVDWNAEGKKLRIAAHEEKIAELAAAAPDGTIEFRGVGRIAPGTYTRANLIALRRAEILRLMGVPTAKAIDRGALLGEREKLLARLAEIDALLLGAGAPATGA